MVAHSDLKVLDPIWTTAPIITRNHGYMIYDTLFAKDEKLASSRRWSTNTRSRADKLTWTFTLRDGLEWHDGTAGHGRGLRRLDQALGRRATRWASSSWPSIGRLKAVDAKTFTIVLKEPFGLVLEALGKPSSNVPFMMPKRVAEHRSEQADRRLHRLRSLHLQEGRMEARREGRLRQEPQVQAARRAAVDAGRRQGRQDRPRRMDRRSPTRRPRSTP